MSQQNRHLRAINFLETLKLSSGPLAGRAMKLAPYQKKFVRGCINKNIKIGVLSIGRGNGKTAVSSGLALASLMGQIDPQPKREVIIAARTREQAKIAFEYVVGFIEGLPAHDQINFVIKRSPILEITFDGVGNHKLTAIAADGRTALGSSPTFVIMDERGHWALEKGNKLEAALLSGIGKRQGRSLIISTSAEDATHPFSKWCDETEAEGVYVQEHRPAPNLPPDDLASLKVANPGAAKGIGSSIEWLQAEARRAIARGGSTLSNFRLYNRNERVSGESRDVLISVDDWQKCEVSELPDRAGSVVIGIDLGGSASMTAAAFYWPETGRLECFGTFPKSPSLLDRGQNDGVSNRYVRMADRGELDTLGYRTVPFKDWLLSILKHVSDQPIAAIVADRYKQAELGQAIDAAGIRSPVIWRGMGWKDGGEDCSRFQRAAYDEKVKVAPSLLLRSAFSDAICLTDPANNLKLAKARSTGRIDAAAATVLAVSHGQRMSETPVSMGRMTWV